MNGSSGPTTVFKRPAPSDADLPAGVAGALAGALASSILSSTCLDALQDCRARRTEEELRSISARALSLRRDLLMLLEQGVSADGNAVALASRAGEPNLPDPRRLRALLFASEVPLRIAQSCHVLLSLSERALDRIGIKSIPEIGTAGALAFAGVAAGVVMARSWLAGIPEGSGTGAAAARRRAERILSEAEIIHFMITDRVRQHLP